MSWPYVLLMTEFHHVIDVSVSDHVLRNIAGSCRHNQELRTRQGIACMTSATDHVETEHGHHELVCGLACELRDVQAKGHLACSTCTTDFHRSGERCVGAEIRSGPTPLVVGSIKSLDQSTADVSLFPDVHTQQLVFDDVDDVDHGLQDALVPKFALVSSAHLRDHVDARGNSVRHSGAMRSLVSSEMLAAGTSAVPTLAITHPRAPLPRVDDTIIRVVDRWQVGSFFLEPLQTRHRPSRSRSVRRAHVQEHSDTRCDVMSGDNHSNGDSMLVP